MSYPLGIRSLKEETLRLQPIRIANCAEWSDPACTFVCKGVCQDAVARSFLVTIISSPNFSSVRYMTNLCTGTLEQMSEFGVFSQKDEMAHEAARQSLNQAESVSLISCFELSSPGKSMTALLSILNRRRKSTKRFSHNRGGGEGSVSPWVPLLGTLLVVSQFPTFQLCCSKCHFSCARQGLRRFDRRCVPGSHHSQSTKSLRRQQSDFCSCCGKNVGQFIRLERGCRIKSAHHSPSRPSREVLSGHYGETERRGGEIAAH